MRNLVALAAVLALPTAVLAEPGAVDWQKKVIEHLPLAEPLLMGEEALSSVAEVDIKGPPDR